MNKSFALALFAVAALASPDKMRKISAGRQRQYLQFLSYNNKFPTSSEEFQKREKNYIDAEITVETLNKRAQEKRLKGVKDPATAAINWTADLDRSEYLQLLGLSPYTEELERVSRELPNERNDGQRGRRSGGDSRRRDGRGGRGRKLIADAINVDWFAAGKVTLVKNQGKCGSCWAFTATSAAETTLAIKANKAPVRLSESQLIDCTTKTEDNEEKFSKTYKTYGCRGGWMPYGWQFQKEQGAMTYQDYPYSDTAQLCQHDEKKIVGKIASWGQVTTSISTAIEKLEEQPLTIAMDASQKVFQFYKDGIIDEDDDCGTSLNHALLIIGYTAKGASPPEPTPTPEPEPTPTPEPEPESVTTCTVTKWWRNCETSTGGRRLADTDGDENYWKALNSWGTNWGNDGFVKIAVRGGSGVCAMNRYIQYVDWEDSMYN